MPRAARSVATTTAIRPAWKSVSTDTQTHWALICKRQGLDPALEVVEGFEPLHSAAPRPLDPLGTGGIKGKRASKKDKLRAAAAAATGALVP